MQIHLDGTEYSRKPMKYEIGLISTNIVNNRVEINVEELAQEVSKGKSFTPAVFNDVDNKVRRSIDNWQSQEVIALDFDEGLTLEEAIEDKFFKENAVFLYTTFSHSDEKHKFRVVFVLDKPLYMYKDFETIINNLLQKYPYADQSCKDGSRLFFGGKKVIEFNFNNRLGVDEIIKKSPLQDIKSNLNMSVNRVVPKHVSNISNHNITNIASNLELIKSKNIEALQEVIEIEPIVLSKNEVFDYLNRQDLKTFLGINGKGNFYDVFHEESNPSASIYKSKLGNEHWMYKCHSESYPFTGTIFHVVQRILECTLVEARKFLIEVFKIEIFESEAVKEFKESIDIYKEQLRSQELEEIHPNFYKVFSRYGHLMDLYVLLDLTKEIITNDKDPRIVFYHSIRTLANHFNRSTSSTGTRMNFFTLFNVIKKLKDNEIPKTLDEIQKKNKRKNQYKYQSSTYELPMYTYDFFCQIDDMCRIWLEKGCTSRTVSYEGIYRTFGQEEADKVFPQDIGKEIADINQEIVSDIHMVTLKLIEEKGWTTQKEVLENLTYIFKGQQEFKLAQLKRSIGEMLEAYDLEIVSCNKMVKEEMGITEEYMSKLSFPKLIRKK